MFTLNLQDSIYYHIEHIKKALYGFVLSKTTQIYLNTYFQERLTLKISFHPHIFVVLSRLPYWRTFWERHPSHPDLSPPRRSIGFRTFLLVFGRRSCLGQDTWIADLVLSGRWWYDPQIEVGVCKSHKFAENKTYINAQFIHYWSI